MLRLVQSNRAEQLLEQLAARLGQRRHLDGVLVPQTVLVQSQGMRQWLTLELAQRQGIVANLTTPMPAAFLWQISQKVMGGELPENSPFDKEAMGWRIMTLLPQLLDEEAFGPLQHYLAGQSQEQLQRYQLAYRIADVFDHYLVYRPDWILDWERGGGADLPPDQAWQPLLWRALVAQVEETAAGEAVHRANIHRQVVEKLRSSEGAGLDLPAYIALFGLSSLPPQQLDMLQALARVCEVEIFALNPCEHYWGDIVSVKNLARKRAAKAGSGADFLEVGNPLLASWGGQGKDFFDMMIEAELPAIDDYVEAGEDSLLGALQQRILRLEASETPYTLAGDDLSVQVHSCHSRMREVEVLRDQLLAMFAQDEQLRARDIVVMVPDIAAYSPYIHAVFSPQGNQASRLRYSISDRSQGMESPLLRSFTALLGLADSRFSAPEIIDLLETPAMARRFDFKPDELRRINRWVEEAGIRWAWDGDDKQSLGLPGNDTNTWRFGLDRLLLGYAVGGVDSLYRGILPSTEVDGNSGDLLGRLQGFLGRLRYWSDTFAVEHSVDQWRELLNACIDEMFEASEEEILALDNLRQGIGRVLGDAATATLEEAITPALLQSLLQKFLTQAGGNYGYLVDGISFCSLMPMRSIPFKVVCIMGMNDQDFPRRQVTPGFDLVAADTPRRGDRNRRSDDRYQFLEALLSARQRLYISYLGRDATDNSEKVAAVLLSELLEYCQEFIDQHPATVIGQLLTHHHLQPFDRRYFDGSDQRWFSYAGEYLDAAGGGSGQEEAGFVDKALPAVVDQGGAIDIGQLQDFVTNPCKALLQQRLGVNLELRDDELSDTEAMVLDNLQNYSLGQSAIEYQLAGVEQGDWRALVEARGEAPLGAPGLQRLEVLWNENLAVSQGVDSLRVPEPVDIPIALTVGGHLLEGTVGPLHGSRLLSYRTGKFKASQILRHWVRHVIACACHEPVTSYLIDGAAQRQFPPIDREQALAWLEVYLPLYREGMCRPIPLFPDTAWAWLEGVKKGDDLKAWAAAEKKWLGDRFPGEAANAYIARCFPDLDAVAEEFREIAGTVVAPAYDALEPCP